MIPWPLTLWTLTLLLLLWFAPLWSSLSIWTYQFPKCHLNEQQAIYTLKLHYAISHFGDLKQRMSVSEGLVPPGTTEWSVKCMLESEVVTHSDWRGRRWCKTSFHSRLHCLSEVCFSFDAMFTCYPWGKMLGFCLWDQIHHLLHDKINFCLWI